MSKAAHIAAWREKVGGWHSPVSGGFRTADTYPTVELLINELWVDITEYVRFDEQIRITRGRSSESSQLDPSTCQLTLDNRDGRFSPRNPLGVYYGYIGRNTPIRVSVHKNGVRRYRFYGEVSSWPTTWDISGTEVTTRIDAAGITRRLTQGDSPLRSAAYREFSSPARTSIVAYWPFEDQTGSTSMVSGIPDSPPMLYTGVPTLAASSVWVGSDPLPQAGTAVFSGKVPVYTLTSEHSFRLLVSVPSTGPTSEGVLFSLRSPTGDIAYWEVSINTSGALKTQAYATDGTELTGTAYVGFDLRGKLTNLVLEIVQNGSSVDWQIFAQNYTDIEFITETIPSSSTSGTIASKTQGAFNRVVVGGGTLGESVVGHISLADDTGAYSATDNAIIGWRGEAASVRLPRLLTEEEGISCQVLTLGNLGNTVTLGLQERKTLVDLIREAAETDLGILYEPRDYIGYAYRTRLSLYSQDPSLTLNYGQHELSSPPVPVDDDQNTRNDITVTRTFGSSYRAALEEGALSTQDPPNGVGRYDDSISISLGTDEQLPLQAGWRLHLGTVDEPRFPDVSINLRHSTFTDSVEMMNSALALDIGARLVITDPPEWLPPDDISLIVQGYAETIGGCEQHEITFVCTPESPYHVGYADDSDTRLDTGGCQLAEDLDTTETSVDVLTTGTQRWVDSATYPNEFPFDLLVGGEMMTATACTGTTLSQTFTVTRSVNGVVKTHLSGATIQLANPSYVAL